MVNKYMNIDEVIERLRYLGPITDKSIRLRSIEFINRRAKCEVCGYIFKDIDDFTEKNPYTGYKDVDKDIVQFFCSDKCMNKYITRNRNTSLDSMTNAQNI